MEPSFQLRKLPGIYKNQLYALLDVDESWKKLMAIIPKTVDKENFACDITRHIPAKYNSQHFKLVETVSTETKRSPTQILLQDWETSDRIHATLGHLLYLLTKAELFGAADYVAVDILKQPPPLRPNKGPAALFVHIKPPQEFNNHEINSQNIPKFSTLMERKTSIPNLSTSRSSPLLKLSLDTKLPHFTYEEILKATDDFSTVDFREAGGRFLGAGAFGSVFLALGLVDKPMAVKKLNLTNVNLVDETDIVTKQFKNEVEILGKYRHENVLSLVGYSCDGCTYCLLYDYLPGEALFERLKSTDNILSWIERMDIALGTAKGIAYLHTASSVPLVHRDVKSANILLDAHKKPKVCDFGLVKLVPDEKTSCTTTVIGTAAYMSPEAFRGDISVKVDTFSFGVVVLELLTSLPPVDDSREGRDLVTHVMDNCEDDITLLLDKKAGTWRSNTMDFADELYKIVQRCLEDKRQRPTMVDVTKSLEKLVTCAYNLDGIKAIQWGRSHEKNGIEFLKTNLGLDVQATGIWLSHSGLLGASPDGLVGDDGIVEVKCPYTYRNDHLSVKLKNSDKYIIFYNDRGEIVVNANHNYYHQIQGNLHILNREKCYLCIWTLKEVTSVLIEIDPGQKI